MTETKRLKTCGFLAFFMMLIFGALLGALGVGLAHILMKFYAQYYLLVIFPLVMAWILGFGLALGVTIGRCTQLNIISVLVVLLFSVVCYGSLLFLNNYYEQQDPRPATIVDEALLFAEDGQNFLHNLPYIGDYVPLAENTEREAQHLGVALTNFTDRFLEVAQHPLVLGTIFDLAIFTPIRDYLIHPGITDWLAATNADGEQIREYGQLILSPGIASTWMLWGVELLLVFLVAFLKVRKASKKALKKRIKKFQKAGLNVGPEQQAKAAKKRKKKKAKKTKTSAIADVELAPELVEGPSATEKEEVTPEDPSGKKAKKAKKEKPKKEKKGFSLFGGKKKKAEEQARGEQTPAVDEAGGMDFPEDQSRYALILHQYDPGRESDLVQLIQQVGQMSPERARRLLKVPSLLKRDVSAQEAKFAIDKFNQVQAQVKLITMDQLVEIQKKQQTAQSPAQPATPPSQPGPATQSPSPVQPPTTPPGERYALILKRFEPGQQAAVLELLSSLSGRPADQLQQTLKPPALILRDATRDEVMMIAQQFQNLQAEVQSVTMTQLQQLIAKSKK